MSGKDRCTGPAEDGGRRRLTPWPVVSVLSVCLHQALLEDCLPDADSPEVGGLMAVLAVIGGIDGRLRLGGQVAHEEFGEGTVTRITPKGRITVQFSDMRTCRVCPLSQLKPVGAPRVPAVQGLRAGTGSGVGAAGRQFAMPSRGHRHRKPLPPPRLPCAGLVGLPQAGRAAAPLWQPREAGRQLGFAVRGRIPHPGPFLWGTVCAAAKPPPVCVRTAGPNAAAAWCSCTHRVMLQ